IRRLTLVAALIAAVVAGCSDAGTPVPFDTVNVTVGDESVTVWVADTAEERARGLKEIEALPDGIDGMLFVWGEVDTRAFTREDTLIPLDIWWFDEDLRLAGVDTMLPCASDPCPTYPSPVAISRALETPAGERARPAGAQLASGWRTPRPVAFREQSASSRAVARVVPRLRRTDPAHPMSAGGDLRAHV